MMMIESVVSVVFVVATILAGAEMLTKIQLNGYRKGKSLHIIPYSLKDVIEALALVIIGIAIVMLTFMSLAVMYPVTLFLLLSIIAYKVICYAKMRTRFKFTHRGFRVYISLITLIALLHITMLVLVDTLWALRILQVSTVIFAPVIVVIVNAALMPFELLNNEKYIKRTKIKLSGIKAVRIGITGSYGKTSCKNILATMLSKKYKVFSTPENYNTPMGMCLSVKKMTGDEEVIIAEMGARRQGDVKKLCDIMRPEYAIITGVGCQHLSEFGNIDKIYNTKRELTEAIPTTGFVVFNGDDEGATRMCSNFYGAKSIVGTSTMLDVYARNLKLSTAGSTFEIIGLGDKIAANTKLLGRHNVVNILMCATIAKKLGVCESDIAIAISEIRPIAHRLEILKNSKGITVIDDSYNANVVGANFALETLRLFSGRRVVFTQGIIEMGKLTKSANRKLGMHIASVADIVILVGKNASLMFDGLDETGFTGKIYRYSAFKEAVENLPNILEQGDTLLIQNDLP
ncbi:MAG: UDP-N-acetylmuramoyl-tripeptide--D-alanyl-D-alanine ligase [Christensenellaceae bacterium]|jgi:UDP-N-acetylmuramoyl-tripeptide--D-alanyl-D-alanine ligase|nr:UDP-N-acetylmuramoyl-tripeptide--D-alanyl-D-alanine ligase [Christensenellaceae bacterium]